MSAPKVIKFTKEEFPSKVAEIKEFVEENGYCVLEPWDKTAETLRTVGSIFGDIQSHIRANEDGVVGVGGAQPKAEWQKFRSEYKGLGTGEFAPHTDGTFVDGFVVEGTRLKKVGPPLYVILQVVRHADTGGASIIVDTQKVLKHLLHNNPEMAAKLMQRGCLTVCRDDQMAMDFPVFELMGYGHFRVRYRGDSKAFAPEWSLREVQLLQTNYHMSPDFRQRVSLEEGQILVCDNTRVLHGREPFSNEDQGGGDGRKLHRIWIYNDQTPEVASLKEEVPKSRVLDPFKPYGPVENELALQDTPPIQTGIRLDGETMAIAAKLIREAMDEKLHP